MSVPRERFADGLTWDEWMDRLEDERFPWEDRFRAASLGSLRADYQSLPTPRYVICVMDPDDADSQAIVPLLAKACDQAGAAGGVDFRLFLLDEARDIADQYMIGEQHELPFCAVFDQDWIQVGFWSYTPERIDGGHDSVLRTFRQSLQGQPIRPWISGPATGEHLMKQAERSREQP